MKTIKLIMILLWMIFLTSCKSQIVCSQIKEAEIVPTPMCDISFQFNRCRCRCFDLNRWDSLPLRYCPDMRVELGFVDYSDSFAKEKKFSSTEAVNLPLNACEGLVGFNYKHIASNIRPKVKQLNIIKEDNCKVK